MREEFSATSGATWIFGIWRTALGFQFYLMIFIVLSVASGICEYLGYGYYSDTIRLLVKCDYKNHIISEICSFTSSSGQYWVREIDIDLKNDILGNNSAASHVYTLRKILTSLIILLPFIPAHFISRRENLELSAINLYRWMPFICIISFLLDRIIDYKLSSIIIGQLDLKGFHTNNIDWEWYWPWVYLFFGWLAYLRYRKLNA